jgi:hypothetical protein
MANNSLGIALILKTATILASAIQQKYVTRTQWVSAQIKRLVHFQASKCNEYYALIGKHILKRENYNAIMEAA